MGKFDKDLQDFRELAKITKEDTPAGKEIKNQLKIFEKNLRKEEIKLFLSGPYDKRSAILTIRSGAGGRDAQDWASLLLRMYQKYCERKKFQTKILDQTFGEGGGPEGRIGVKDVSLEIKGKWAFGLFKNEQGVHRLVRISPFSSNALRHTSFAQVEVLPEIPKVQLSRLKIKSEDLKIDTFRASGPGGQYVNKRESAVRITHLPTGLVASSQVERFQGLNKEIAMRILETKLLFYQEKARENKLEKLRGKNTPPTWSHQIRSYILHPYQLVKDHRTGVETSNVDDVLDGDLDPFIEVEMRQKIKGGSIK